jgi:DNA repair exonuclease SbcCD ATPase subunit
MRIRTILLDGFMSHDKSMIGLPEDGIVVVTGPNGAGKSSVIEAVSVCCWGKTLRGGPGWQTGAEASVCAARADGITVSRSRENGKTKLAWSLEDDDTPTGRLFDTLARMGGTPKNVFESTTQAQEALERLVGSWDVWRRANAFSSSDAAHFSLATDGERKRLVETILGLGRFDIALANCRADATEAEKLLGQATLATSSCMSDVRNEEKRLADAKEAAERAQQELPPLPAEPDPEAVKRISSRIEATRRSLSDARAKQRAVSQRLMEADMAARNALDAFRRLDRDACPTCAQPISPEKQRAAEKVSREAVANREDVLQSTKASSVEIQAELTELEETEAELNTRLATAKAAAAIYAEKKTARDRAEQQHNEAQRRLRVALQRLDAAKTKLDEAKSFEAAAGRTYSTLRAIDAVLGLRGVRAHILSRSLSGLSGVANAWLPRLGLPELSIEIKPYAEKKTGGVTDAISIEVRGAGGGHGYRNSSAGERRRIDLALLLGISEIAAGANGRTGSTMFFDELFDALDTDGVKAVSVALSDLARDRCVVVITHNEELAQSLPAVKRLRVEAGKVEEV